MSNEHRSITLVNKFELLLCHKMEISCFFMHFFCAESKSSFRFIPVGFTEIFVYFDLCRFSKFYTIMCKNLCNLM